MMNGGDKNELNMNDSAYIAKCLPIISPEPESKGTSHITTTIPYSSFTRSTNTLLGHDAHLLGNNASEQNIREFTTEQPLMGMSSRWSPTPEQLLALEEMYRSGTRTPRAEQIQQIASQLRRFGKIEGKNVFYWFQNHKARERQKRHRALQTSCEVLKHDTTGSQDMKESAAAGLRRTVYEAELQKQTLVMVPPSSCSETLEEPVLMLRGGTTESTTPYEWLQFEERESHKHKSCSLEKKGTRLSMDLHPSYPIQHINNRTTICSRFLNSQRQSSWFKPSRRRDNDENKIGEVETLDLFPVCSEDCSGVNGSKNDIEVPITVINTKLMSPNQYFEFLPLKN